MTKELWLNLPVADLKRAREFFKSLGFKLHDMPDDQADITGIMVSTKDIPVMLVSHERFRHFSGQQICDTSQACEVLISIDAENRSEVDELARKAREAGGQVFGPPTEIEGWMYGCGFTDLDGHRWNVLYMDKSKMPAPQ